MKPQTKYNANDFKSLLSCFSKTSEEQWNNWEWQKENSFAINYADSPERKKETLKKISDATGLPVEEFSKLEQTLKKWNVIITPHQALQIRRKLSEGDKESAIALFSTVKPSAFETQFQQTVKLKTDGSGVGYRREEKYNTTENPQPPVIRRLYDDRVILAPTFECPTACRYCFRKAEATRSKEAKWQEGIEYIKKWNATHKKEEQIKDIIVSGGDPLCLSDEKIEEILTKVKSTPGVKFVRIDTKFPAAMPQRFTPKLIEILGKHVDFMCFHFAHAAEISPETKKACMQLSKKGIMLSSYIPLLKGVNDSRETLKTLFQTLFTECKTRPYYLVHFIETFGAQHFRVPLEEGIKLMDGMQTEISGPAIPQFMLYLPEGGGKYIFGVNRTPIKRTREGYWIPSAIYKGKLCLYPDPIPKNKPFKEFEI